MQPYENGKKGLKKKKHTKRKIYRGINFFVFVLNSSIITNKVVIPKIGQFNNACLDTNSKQTNTLSSPIDNTNFSTLTLFSRTTSVAACPACLAPHYSDRQAAQTRSREGPVQTRQRPARPEIFGLRYHSYISTLGLLVSMLTD